MEMNYPDLFQSIDGLWSIGYVLRLRSAWPFCKRVSIRNHRSVMNFQAKGVCMQYVCQSSFIKDHWEWH